MKSEYGIVCDETKCVGCHGCETACHSWRQLSPKMQWRHVKRIWQGSLEAPLLRHISFSCQHCIEPACLVVCPGGAITRSASGHVRVQREQCLGCKACAGACPFGIPSFDEGRYMHKCDLCMDTQEGTPSCVATCPTGALRMVCMSLEEKHAEEQRLLQLLKSSLV